MHPEATGPWRRRIHGRGTLRGEEAGTLVVSIFGLGFRAWAPEREMILPKSSCRMSRYREHQDYQESNEFAKCTQYSQFTILTNRRSLPLTRLQELPVVAHAASQHSSMHEMIAGEALKKDAG